MRKYNSRLADNLHFNWYRVIRRLTVALHFQKNETNICKMTKKGQKMSFHARKVEIMANIGIMEIVIERHREAEPLIFTGVRRFGVLILTLPI